MQRCLRHSVSTTIICWGTRPLSLSIVEQIQKGGDSSGDCWRCDLQAKNKLRNWHDQPNSRLSQCRVLQVLLWLSADLNLLTPISSIPRCASDYSQHFGAEPVEYQCFEPKLSPEWNPIIRNRRLGSGFDGVTCVEPMNDFFAMSRRIYEMRKNHLHTGSIDSKYYLCSTLKVLW